MKSNQSTSTNIFLSLLMFSTIPFAMSQESIQTEESKIPVIALNSLIGDKIRVEVRASEKVRLYNVYLNNYTGANEGARHLIRERVRNKSIEDLKRDFKDPWYSILSFEDSVYVNSINLKHAKCVESQVDELKNFIDSARGDVAQAIEDHNIKTVILNVKLNEKMQKLKPLLIENGELELTISSSAISGCHIVTKEDLQKRYLQIHNAEKEELKLLIIGTLGSLSKAKPSTIYGINNTSNPKEKVSATVVTTNTSGALSK